MSLLDALLLDPVRIDVWVAWRTDGVAGSGTQQDPYDGSTLTKFDTLMNALPANTCVHLGETVSPNVFQTAGYYDDLSGTGWQAKSGMRIVGSGIDVTTLKLVSAATTQRAYAIAHAITSSTVDFFEVCDLTIDCNFVPSQGTSWTAGAVRIMGNHSRVVRVKVKNWGNKATGTPGFVIAMLTGDPASGVIGVSNCGIEECIAVSPHASAVGPVTVLHVGGREVPNTAAAEPLGLGPYLRNCFVDCGQATPFTLECRALSMTCCRSGIVEGNQVHNTKYGGPYQEFSTTRSLVVRGNTLRNVVKGPYWKLGTKTGAPKTLSSLTFTALSVGYEATGTTTTSHYLNTGDRVQVLCTPSTLNGTFLVTTVVDATHFKYRTLVNGTFSSGTAEKVYSIGKLVVDENAIELATGSDGLTAIHLDDNALTNQSPDYAHGDVQLRGSTVRYVDGAFDGTYAGYAVQANGAKNLIVRNNVVDCAPLNPLRNRRCGSVEYFDDTTPAGVLIRGYNEDTSRRYDELETDAEDAFILGMLKHK
jgi:hypothetical protein